MNPPKFQSIIAHRCNNNKTTESWLTVIAEQTPLMIKRENNNRSK